MHERIKKKNSTGKIFFFSIGFGPQGTVMKNKKGGKPCIVTGNKMNMYVPVMYIQGKDFSYYRGKQIK